jgi:hypothetical protein
MDSVPPPTAPAVRWACTHTHCISTNYTLHPTYVSKGKRDQRERMATNISCCTALTRCPTGHVWVAKGYKLPDPRTVLAPTGKFPCNHTGCQLILAHQPARSTHEHNKQLYQDSHGCSLQCVACDVMKRFAPAPLQPQPQPQPQPQQPTQVFLLEQLVEGLRHLQEHPPTKI